MTDMTESLLQQLEEKTMILLSEIEDCRKELRFAQQENALLIQKNALLEKEREQNGRKLQDLISLLDDVPTNHDDKRLSGATLAAASHLSVKLHKDEVLN